MGRSSTSCSAALALVLAVIAALAAPAHADEPPWYRGVPKARQKEATELFRRGNTFFEQNEYARAAELYLQAVAIWDHPGIHFNLVVALVNLDRVVEAYEHLEGAMRFGVPGLETAARFKEAQTYKRLLEGRLVMFSVEAAQGGVEITLDGRPIAPGEQRIVLPGAHALVATKAGFEPMTKNLTLVGGTVVERIELAPRRRTRVVRRYRTWVPWTIAGIGAGVAAAGGGAIVLGRIHQDRFEAQFARACPEGCVLGAPDRAVEWGLHDRARLEHGVGLAGLAAGGATLLTGLILVALNAPREVEDRATAVLVTPGGDGGLGLSVLGRF